MIDLVVSCMTDFILIEYVPHMFVAIAVLGLVNIIKRMITLNF